MTTTKREVVLGPEKAEDTTPTQRKHMNEQHTHHGYAVYEWETCSLLTFCTLQTKNIKTQIRDQVLHSTGMHG